MHAKTPSLPVSIMSVVSLVGCSSGDLPPPAEPRETWAPSPPAPAAIAHPAAPASEGRAKPTARGRNADSSNAAELFDCLGPSVCPDLEARAKRRAAAAFGCALEDIQTKERPTRGLAVNLPTMLINAQGKVELHVQAPRPGNAFYVRGCGQEGLLACVWANRSVRTADVSYENTEDRVCLWADWVDEPPQPAASNENAR
jgi:hypothetical protein